MTGTGSVQAEPDLGLVSLRVLSTQPSAAEAAAAAAQVAAAVTGALGALPGINATQDVTTTGVSLHEQWAYGQGGQRSPQPTG